jgi:4-hydroxy-tetrahydrodipicolinate reductase
MKTTVRVLLIGSAGRMGQTIVNVAKGDPGIDVVALCDIGDPIEPAISCCDVAIDFSHADAIDGICQAALQNRKPVVIGTTGHSPEQRQKIEHAAEVIPFVFAANFSVGVNALFWLTRKAAAMLGGEFNPQIIETHHKMKKDAPSGTAKTLAEILKRSRGSDAEIPIQSTRQGKVVGDHTIIFTGPGERLELTHRASTREIFARGALRAAQWVLGKPPRLYTMQDVLGL